MKTYKTLAVTIRLPEDEDLLHILDRVRRPISPWVREAIRERWEREQTEVDVRRGRR